MDPICNIYYVGTKLMPRDIYPLQFGEQACSSNYGFGPCIRNHYFIHYVYSGKGRFEAEGKVYHLSAGQLFLIYPGQLTYYQADSDQPWFYRWIEFNGNLSETILKSAGLSKTSPILTDTDNFPIGKALKKLVGKGQTSFEDLMSSFWSFIAKLTVDSDANNITDPKAEYVQRAENYINMYLYRKITISEIAEYVGINRSYLSRLFKQYKGVSTQQYMIATKLDTAAQYLKNVNLSVREVAKSVGYDDPLEFSKAFKARFKLSPVMWRNEIFWKQSVKEYR